MPATRAGPQDADSVANVEPEDRLGDLRFWAAIRAIGRTPRQRTTLYGAPPGERVAASFGAAPLSEPLDPPAREAGLKPLPLLAAGLGAQA